MAGCVPNTVSFTPCQAAALRNLNPVQQKEFAKAVGLSHALEAFLEANPISKPNTIPATNLGFPAILPTVDNMATLIRPGSLKIHG